MLERSNIYTLKVAEIENLLCTEKVIRIISQHLNLNPDDIFLEVKGFILEKLKNDLGRQVSRYTTILIQSKLNSFDKKVIGKENFELSFNELFANIDVNAIYDESNTIFQSIIDNADYEKALKYYNEKSLLKRFSPIFGLILGEYEDLIVRLLFTNRKNDLVSAFKDYLPDFS